MLFVQQGATMMSMLPQKLRDYMVKVKGQKRYGTDLITVPPTYTPISKAPGIELAQLPESKTSGPKLQERKELEELPVEKAHHSKEEEIKEKPNDTNSHHEQCINETNGRLSAD